LDEANDGGREGSEGRVGDNGQFLGDWKKTVVRRGVRSWGEKSLAVLRILRCV